MAVTKIWAIHGRIGDVLSYAANESKTVNPNYHPEKIQYTEEDVQGLYDVMNYAMDDAKTEDRLFVTGVNCDAETARNDMIETKEYWHKEDGIVAFHMYQSFRPGEATPEIAHTIGVKLAQELLGDRFEAIVATHLNTSCLHNHIVINSVSSKDGLKFYSQRKTVYEIRRISDRLCREYGLSVVDHPNGKGKNYAEWQAEKNGEYTKSGIIKRDIDECIGSAGSEKQFYALMRSRGYAFNLERKYPTITHKNFERARRLKTLGEEYTPEEIRRRIYSKSRITRPRFFEEDDAEKIFFDGDRNSTDVFKNRQSIYVHFVCGIAVVKSRPDENRELMRLLGDEIIKFDKRVEEQNLMLDNDLFTDADVEKFRQGLQTELSELDGIRRKLRNELKRAGRRDDLTKQDLIRSDIGNVTERMKKLRNQDSICGRILSQGQDVEKGLNSVKDYIENSKRKEREAYEQFRGRGGTSR